MPFRDFEVGFRDRFYAPDGDLNPLGLTCLLVFLAIGAALLYGFACRWQEREHAADERRFRDLFPEWRLVEGGRRLNDMEFFGHCLSGYSPPLRPLWEREAAGGKLWLFRFNHSGKATYHAAGLAICVVRRPGWRWPRLRLRNRGTEQLGELGIGLPTPRRFRERWPDLCERWSIEVVSDEAAAERFLEFFAADLIAKPAARLVRIDVGGPYLACAGSPGYSPESFRAVLKAAERLAERLDRARQDV